MPPEPAAAVVAVPPAKGRRRRKLPLGMARADGAAAWCSVGLRTWRSWDSAGLIPRPRRIGGVVLWSMRDLRAWRDAGCPDRWTFEAMGAAATCGTACREGKRR